METNKLVTGVVAAAISIIVLAAVLMPVLDDATATSDTFTNEGYFYMDKYKTGDTFSLSWDRTNPTEITVNSDTLEFTNTSGLALSIVLGEKFFLRIGTSNNLVFYGNGTYVTASETYPTITMTYSSDTITVTNTNTTKIISGVDEFYCISADKGDYVMKKSAATAYLNSGSEIVADSDVYATGETYNGNNNIFWHLEGTIDDMSYPDVFNTNFTVSNETINGKYSDSHNDLYELKNFQFTVTTNTSIVYNITASYFVVPAEVTAERSVHFDPATNGIIAVIPVLIIIAILLGVVAFYLTSRE